MVTAVWIGAYTVPNWTRLVAEEVAESEGNPYVIAALYLSHTLNNAAHNLANSNPTPNPIPYPNPNLNPSPSPKP